MWKSNYGRPDYGRPLAPQPRGQTPGMGPPGGMPQHRNSAPFYPSGPGQGYMQPVHSARSMPPATPRPAPPSSYGGDYNDLPLNQNSFRSGAPQGPAAAQNYPPTEYSNNSEYYDPYNDGTYNNSSDQQRHRMPEAEGYPPPPPRWSGHGQSYGGEGRLSQAHEQPSQRDPYENQYYGDGYDEGYNEEKEYAQPSVGYPPLEPELGAIVSQPNLPWQYCDDCEIHFKNEQSFRQHCLGMLHKKRHEDNEEIRQRQEELKQKAIAATAKAPVRSILKNRSAPKEPEPKPPAPIIDPYERNNSEERTQSRPDDLKQSRDPYGEGEYNRPRDFTQPDPARGDRGPDRFRENRFPHGPEGVKDIAGNHPDFEHDPYFEDPRKGDDAVMKKQDFRDYPYRSRTDEVDHQSLERRDPNYSERMDVLPHREHKDAFPYRERMDAPHRESLDAPPYREHMDAPPYGECMDGPHREQMDSPYREHMGASPYRGADAPPHRERVDAPPLRERVDALPHRERMDTLPHRERMDAPPHRERIDALPHRERMDVLPHRERMDAMAHGEHRDSPLRENIDTPGERLAALPNRERLDSDYQHDRYERFRRESSYDSQHGHRPAQRDPYSQDLLGMGQTSVREDPYGDNSYRDRSPAGRPGSQWEGLPPRHEGRREESPMFPHSHGRRDRPSPYSSRGSRERSPAPRMHEPSPPIKLPSSQTYEGDVPRTDHRYDRFEQDRKGEPHNRNERGRDSYAQIDRPEGRGDANNYANISKEVHHDMSKNRERYGEDVRGLPSDKDDYFSLKPALNEPSVMHNKHTESRLQTDTQSDFWSQASSNPRIPTFDSLPGLSPIKPATPNIAGIPGLDSWSSANEPPIVDTSVFQTLSFTEPRPDKEEEKRIEMYCKACDSKMKGMNNYRIHIQGKKHFRNLIEELKKEEIDPNSFCCEYLNKAPGLNPPSSDDFPKYFHEMLELTFFNITVRSIVMSKEEKKTYKEFVLNSGKLGNYFCQPCSKALYCLELWIPHIVGISHAKKCQEILSQIGKEEFMRRYATTPGPNPDILPQLMKNVSQAAPQAKERLATQKPSVPEVKAQSIPTITTTAREGRVRNQVGQGVTQDDKVFLYPVSQVNQPLNQPKMLFPAAAQMTGSGADKPAMSAIKDVSNLGPAPRPADTSQLLAAAAGIDIESLKNREAQVLLRPEWNSSINKWIEDNQQMLKMDTRYLLPVYVDHRHVLIPRVAALQYIDQVEEEIKKGTRKRKLDSPPQASHKRDRPSPPDRKTRERSSEDLTRSKRSQERSRPVAGYKRKNEDSERRKRDGRQGPYDQSHSTADSDNRRSRDRSSKRERGGSSKLVERQDRDRSARERGSNRETGASNLVESQDRDLRKKGRKMERGAYWHLVEGWENKSRERASNRGKEASADSVESKDKKVKAGREKRERDASNLTGNTDRNSSETGCSRERHAVEIDEKKSRKNADKNEPEKTPDVVKSERRKARIYRSHNREQEVPVDAVESQKVKHNEKKGNLAGKVIESEKKGLEDKQRKKDGSLDVLEKDSRRSKGIKGSQPRASSKASVDKKESQTETGVNSADTTVSDSKAKAAGKAHTSKISAEKSSNTERGRKGYHNKDDTSKKSSENKPKSSSEGERGRKENRKSSSRLCSRPAKKDSKSSSSKHGIHSRNSDRKDKRRHSQRDETQNKNKEPEEEEAIEDEVDFMSFLPDGFVVLDEEIDEEQSDDSGGNLQDDENAKEEVGEESEEVDANEEVGEESEVEEILEETHVTEEVDGTDEEEEIEEVEEIHEIEEEVDEEEVDTKNVTEIEHGGGSNNVTTEVVTSTVENFTPGAVAPSDQTKVSASKEFVPEIDQKHHERASPETQAAKNITTVAKQQPVSSSDADAKLSTVGEISQESLENPMTVPKSMPDVAKLSCEAPNEVDENTNDSDGLHAVVTCGSVIEVACVEPGEQKESVDGKLSNVAETTEDPAPGGLAKDHCPVLPETDPLPGKTSKVEGVFPGEIAKEGDAATVNEVALDQEKMSDTKEESSKSQEKNNSKDKCKMS